MSTISKFDFIAGVNKSAVIDRKRLEEWLKVVEGESAQDIAAKLIRDQLLTKWQAKYLMSGRTRLDIGSYRLLERIQRDELGDRFLALHTSLARKVDLQVLPSTLTKDKLRCDEFMRKASLAAKLDHPNLIHVYDIDRESGRLFLVTEHVEGTSLDKFARTKLNEKEIARLVVQVIAGISHAHEHNVIHGCITQSDLVLTDDDEVKIQNLSVFPLRQEHAASDHVPTITDDYAAISKIGVSLLKEIPDSKRSPGFESLAGIFDDFRPSEANSKDALSGSLGGWLKSNGGMVSGEPAELDQADPFAGGFDQPIATTSVPKKKKLPEKEPKPPIEPEEKPRRAIPVALIAIAGVIMLIGGSAWGVISLLNNDGANVAKNDSNAAASGNRTSTGANGKRGNANKKNRTNSVSPINKGGGLKPPNFQDVESMSKLIDNLPVESGASITEKGASANKGKPKNVAPANKPPKTSTNNQVVAAKRIYPDTTVFAAPKTKQQLELGPNKMVIPANTPLKIIHQASNGYVEIEAIMSDNSVRTGFVKADEIFDSAVVAVPNQPPAGPPTSNAPDKGNPTGNAPVEADSPKPKDTTPTPDASINKPAANSTPDVLTKISGIGEATQDVLFKNGVTTFKQLAAMSPDKLKELLTKANFLRPAQQHANWIAQAKVLIGETPGAENPGPAENPAPTETAGPFANFPRITDLPPVNKTDEVKLADLVIKKQYLLGAEILCEPGVSKTKLIFEIRRTADDKQKWIVGVKRRPKEKPTDIAYFRKSENAFHFQWLPEAEKNKYANFLRNCYLKLKLPEDQSTFLTLRQPVKIPDLRLTEQELINSIEVDIPWLPDPDSVVIEVLPLRVQGVDSTVAKSGIEKGMPGKIWLKRQDKTGFLWLQVGAEFRSKLKLQSNLVLLANGQSKPVRNLQELSDLAAIIKQNEFRAVVLNQQAQAQKAPANKKAEYDKRKQEFQKQEKDAKAMSAKVVEYGQVLPKILNQPVSVRVYAKLGKFQTILAVTDPTLNEKKLAEKK